MLGFNKGLNCLNRKKKILLLSNFRLDNQFSMLKVAKILTATNSDFLIDEFYPKPVISNLLHKSNVRKWASYIDKYLIFIKRIKYYLRKNYDIIHITDQSNAIYTPQIKRQSNAPVQITCHDLNAIHQPKNEFKKAPKVSKTGKILQSWIHKSLKTADYYACDSEQTKNDLNRIIPSSLLHSKVIYMGTEFKIENAKSPKYKEEKLSFNILSTRFILHVGSAAWYKNRKAVFQAFQFAKHQNHSNNLKLVLVGPSPQADEIDASLKKWLDNNTKDIISVTNASDQVLQELYMNAEFLIFPSYIEGFGWPPLEAALSGCPVICTKTGAIHDILGKNARYVNPKDQSSINNLVSEVLQKQNMRSHKVSLPTNKQCQEEYYNLYQRLIKK